jgi:hypothetical protein
MSFTRVEQDGLEFYTLKANGTSGMSIAALARLCGVEHNSIREVLKRIHGKKTTSKWLKPFIDEDFYLAINLRGQAKIIRADVCFAIICYYAFKSSRAPAEAKYAFGKFGPMGIEGWIHGITGWQPETAAPELTEDRVAAFIEARLSPGGIPIEINPDSVIELLKRNDFTRAGYRLYFYLEMMHLHDAHPDEQQICKDLKIAPSTLRKWLPKVQARSHCADWLKLPGRKGPEYPIQLRMHAELGGIMEASTPIGPVDLVTSSEVIEIKRIEDWKEALGQVMAKAQCFPDLSMRIHLFGESSKILRKITQHCQFLNVIVTFETVVSDRPKVIVPNQP